MLLSSQNRIACYGFVLMGAIGTYVAFSPLFLQPIDVLTHLGTTTATLENDYTESKTKEGEILQYNISYTYTIDGKEYRGSSATTQAPSPTMTVQYVTNSPDISGMELGKGAYLDLIYFAIVLGVLVAAGVALVLDARGGPRPAPAKAESRRRSARRN